MTDAAVSEIEVRKPGFVWPDDLPVMPVPDDPATSCELLGLSFTLPYLEPYLIRTMRSAAKLVDDPLLRADMKAFSGQEAQHYRQHARVNDIVRSQLTPSTAAAMQRLEDALEADYRRFTETKSDRFNLAYGEGFEAMTFALARSVLESSDAERSDPAWAGLIGWHLAEEIEHRTVTFDAYDQTYGGWFYRAVVGTWAQLHFLRCLISMAAVCRKDLMPAEATFFKAARYSFGRQREIGTLKGMLLALSPRYNPRHVRLSEEVVAMSRLVGVDLR